METGFRDTFSPEGAETGRMYTLEEAAEFLGLKPTSIRTYMAKGRLRARKTSDGYVFDEGELRSYRACQQYDITSPESFDEKHGEGAHKALVLMLKDPSKTYGEIGSRFSVSRQRAKQWDKKLSARHRLKPVRRREYRAKRARDEITEFNTRKLLENDLFSSFYGIASSYFPETDIHPIPTSDFNRYGFSRRSVRIHDRKILIKKATKWRNRTARQHSNIYTINTNSDNADFVFYLLDNRDFLFVSTSDLPQNGTTFIDSERSRYRRFRNNFDALKAEDAEARAM